MSKSSRPPMQGRAYWKRLTELASGYHAPTILRDQFGYLWQEHLRSFSRPDALHGLIRIDCLDAATALLSHWDPDKDAIYRVALDPFTQRVEVTHFGLDAALVDELGIYDSVDSLPKWMQERLAMLSMMGSKPPTTPVEGVGQRINQNTYWLVR